ncbi:trypsin-like peptidase domain-containing protein [Nostoc sp. CMAA1605]|uniref:trypsin-like peptidase domain-containing protein n=1 Tax=Nostoc sp. CMAA1605 TaxID=2055159 RepID=UPI001F2CC769|nr:trypsin-like peptidase domain-containing protein [Nostoc sp. CMAA1605]MCF4968573.1 serine/threonine protein kinase [Nostoc sp. CMAA1605]
MRVTGGLAALLLGTGIVIVQPVATALTPSEIANIARQITVRIDGANTGSGVIIERQGNVYTVVTNWHVVQLQGNYTVQTSDGKRYTFNNSQVKRFPGVDLAVFQFTSNTNYRVAEKGNSDQVALGTNIAVAGYPQGTSDIDFRRGAISRMVSNPKDGYAFVYDIGGFPGMSGGAILDEQGKLVGIHGRATTRPDTNATIVLGIPLKTYLSFASSVQPVASAPAPTPTRTPKPPQPTTSKPVTLNNSSSNFVLAKTLKGHSDLVWSVAISPDGRTLASGSDDKTIKIWNIATGQEIRTLNGHSYAVISVAISPDGRTLASGGAGDKTIKIWNIATGQEIRTLNGHSRSVFSVAISPDGRTLASGSVDNTIKIWNIATGQEIRTLNGHSDSVYSVAISPDGRTLASGSDDNTIKIWNIATGQEIRTLNGHSNLVTSVAISPDGRTLASGSWDKTIKIWNIATGQEIRTLNGHSSSVISVAISPDGRTLASGGYKAIKIWNTTTGQEIRTLNGHSSWVRSVAISPDGRTLASGSDDKTIKIWRLSD